jgi:hypothetical protein
MGAVGDVRGMATAIKQAEEGMKLFAEEVAIEGDVAAATAFKEQQDAKMVAIEKEAAALTGKENKKMRSEKDKQRAVMKVEKEYIDACKVVKGLAPIHGHFVKNAPEVAVAAPKAAEPAAAPAEVEKKDSKKKDSKKAQDSAGISRAERDELESLKNKIIEKKTTLKGSGMTGGQINKDEEIVAWVARMTELKEKENPGSASAGKDEKKGSKKKKLDSESVAMMVEKQKEFDEYTEKLRTEFKYSKKEIAADPEYQEMKAALDKLQNGK